MYQVKLNSIHSIVFRKIFYIPFFKKKYQFYMEKSWTKSSFICVYTLLNQVPPSKMKKKKIQMGINCVPFKYTIVYPFNASLHELLCFWLVKLSVRKTTSFMNIEKKLRKTIQEVWDKINMTDTKKNYTILKRSKQNCTHEKRLINRIKKFSRNK